MPYTAGNFNVPHLYLQWGGKLPGNERWSCGLRLAPTAVGSHPLTDAAGLLAAAKTCVQNFHTRATSQINNYCLLSSVKLNPITTAGLYALGTTNEAIVADVSGGGIASRPPNQVALVATLRTAFSRGPAHSGRFYIPMPSMLVETTGLISTTAASDLKASLATFLTDLNALSASYRVAVMSRKAGAPADNAVTSIEVGRVLDTQRRRRRSLIENYV